MSSRTPTGNRPPTNNVAWNDDVFTALDSAKRRCGHLLAQNPDEILEVLYRRAPAQAATRRGITDEALVARMTEHACDNVEFGFSVDEDAATYWEFNFVLAYLHSHVEAELIDEFKLDRIMDYLVEQHDFFGE